MRVHRNPGPGLLERVYETCLAFELERSNIPFRRKVILPVVYDQVYLNCAYIADIIACIRGIRDETVPPERLPRPSTSQRLPGLSSDPPQFNRAPPATYPPSTARSSSVIPVTFPKGIVCVVTA
jgi:PD-(D/E)XK nuclease superfamily